MKQRKRARRRKPRHSRPATKRLLLPGPADPLAGLSLSSEEVATLASMHVVTGEMKAATLSRSIAMAHQDGRATVPSGLVAPKNAALFPRRHPPVPAVEAPSVKPGPPVEQRTKDVIVQGAQFEAAGLGGQPLTTLLLKYRPELSEKPSKARVWFQNLKRKHPWRTILKDIQQDFDTHPEKREYLQQHWRESIEAVSLPEQ